MRPRDDVDQEIRHRAGLSTTPQFNLHVEREEEQHRAKNRHTDQPRPEPAPSIKPQFRR